MMMKRTKIAAVIGMVAMLVVAAAAVAAQAPQGSTDTKSTDVSVTITGGFETDPRDHGRPVVSVRHFRA